MLIKDKKGASKNFLALMLVLAILISIIGTYVSLTSVNNVSTIRERPNVATVGVKIVQPPLAYVGVEVIGKEEYEKNG